MKQYKALALISGGLDSMLAAKMIMAQGVYVEGINFYTGFCGDEVEQVSCAKKCAEKKVINARWVTDKIGIKLNIVNVAEDYKRIVLEPQHGYGAHLNPCLDCKIFMVAKAKEWAMQNGFDFIITGEVMGQRPMSQLKHMLPVVARESGADDLLLRPLSAKFLTPTLPEREGWVNRDELGSCAGRSRAMQMELLKKYGITEYAQPSGGCCFLINKHYTNRLKDLWQARGKKDYSSNDVVLLKAGRHLRPASNFKIIMGRNEIENKFFEKYVNEFVSVQSISHLGPFAIIDGILQNEFDIELASKIVARYCDTISGELVKVRIKLLDGTEIIKDISPFADEELLQSWMV